MRLRRQHSVLPGFRLTMGFTLMYLTLLVLVPLATLPLRTMSLGWAGFWEAATDPRVVASYRLSIGASLAAAVVNALFGLVIAWVLARYSFPGRRLVDAVVDLPFALPTAVAGIALVTLYAPNGWIGSRLEPLGIKAAFSPLGIGIALTFIGLPFVVRTLQPVIEELDPEVEEAAASLGASRLTTFRRIILPSLLPAITAGAALSFARGVSEYGSLVLLSGNLPFETEVTSVRILSSIENDNLPNAAAVATILLAISLAVIVLLDVLQRRMVRRG
jgi:sulfate transport system permease protein